MTGTTGLHLGEGQCHTGKDAIDEELHLPERSSAEGVALGQLRHESDRGHTSAYILEGTDQHADPLVGHVDVPELLVGCGEVAVSHMRW